MTTPFQRFLNIVFVLVAMIPPIAAVWFFLENPHYRVFTPLVALAAGLPMLILAGLSFIQYRKFTVWHAASDSTIPAGKQKALALISAALVTVYAASVLVFFLKDTQPLYLECEIKKSDKKEDIGKAVVFSIRRLTPIYDGSTDDYWAFEGRGWLGDSAFDLGIGWWDFAEHKWHSPLSPLERGPLSEVLRADDGGLVVYPDQLVSRGRRYNAAEAAKYAFLDDDNLSYEYFDRLSISRSTGKLVMSDGLEGMCKKTVDPEVSVAPAAATNNKF